LRVAVSMALQPRADNSYQGAWRGSVSCWCLWSNKEVAALEKAHVHSVLCSSRYRQSSTRRSSRYECTPLCFLCLHATGLLGRVEWESLFTALSKQRVAHELLLQRRWAMAAYFARFSEEYISPRFNTSMYIEQNLGLAQRETATHRWCQKLPLTFSCGSYRNRTSCIRAFRGCRILENVHVTRVNFTPSFSVPQTAHLDRTFR